MCAPLATLVPIITSVAGAGMSLYGQSKQQKAQDDYNNKQKMLETKQKQLALTQQQAEDVVWKEKSANIIDEAGKTSAAAPRQEAMQKAENTANASNVAALEQAQAVGGDAIGKSYEGGQSDAYLKARAQAASDQTSKAIAMARLFAKQGAVGNAMQNQAIGAIDNTLQDQSLNFRARQARRGYDNAQDLISKQQSAIQLDTNAGQAEGAIGGLLFNSGAKGLGGLVGKAGGLGKLFG